MATESRSMTATSPLKDSRVSVSSLLSPPEPVRPESFIHTSRQPNFGASASAPVFKGFKYANLVVDGVLISPPLSDYDKFDESQQATDGSGLRDPQLFSERDDVSADAPLFTDDSYVSELGRTISQYMANNAHTPEPKPTQGEYQLVCEFVSCCWANYNRDPVAYARRELELLKYYGKRRVTAPVSSRVDKTKRYKAIAPAPTGTRKASKPSGARSQAPKRVTKRSPKTKPQDSFDSPKTPKAVINREDIDYNSLVDWSPPMEPLNLSKNAFKTDWKGQQLDLSRDPDVHLLYEQEVNLAATLRLSAATYLCSKRRIFKGRVEALRKGKEFRKTDAQQACRIDVNKASKLWTAFDRNGMFKPSLFAHHL